MEKQKTKILFRSLSSSICSICIIGRKGCQPLNGSRPAIIQCDAAVAYDVVGDFVVVNIAKFALRVGPGAALRALKHSASWVVSPRIVAGALFSAQTMELPESFPFGRNDFHRVPLSVHLLCRVHMLIAWSTARSSKLSHPSVLQSVDGVPPHVGATNNNIVILL